METVELDVVKRAGFGKEESKRIRHAGNIPGVIYAGGSDADTLTLDSHSYQVKVKGAKSAQLFKFKSEDEGLDGKLVVLKDIQFHPVKGTVLHIDFLRVDEGQTIPVFVPVELTGESEVVKAGLALLNQTVYEVEVECLPEQIPTSVSIDISSLQVGEVLHAKAIELPENVVLRSNERQVVVNAIGKRGSKEDEQAGAAEAAPAEGAAAEPAAG